MTATSSNLSDGRAETPRTPPDNPDKQHTTYDSSTLFAGQRLVLIRHGASLYRLCITSRGKLILQK